MLGFLKKAFDFVRYPTHTRTMGIVVILVLVSAVSLTVIVAQQQQQLKQHAANEKDCNVTASSYCASTASANQCIAQTCDNLQSMAAPWKCTRYTFEDNNCSVPTGKTAEQLGCKTDADYSTLTGIKCGIISNTNDTNSSQEVTCYNDPTCPAYSIDAYNNCVAGCNGRETQCIADKLNECLNAPSSTETSQPATQPQTPQSPTTPTLLNFNDTISITPSACPDSSIKFSWKKIVNADKYLLYRYGVTTAVCETSNITCTDSTVKEGNNKYKFSVMQGSKEISYTPWMSVAVPSCLTAPPAVPPAAPGAPAPTTTKTGTTTVPTPSAPTPTATSTSCPDNQRISSSETSLQLNNIAPSITLSIEKLYVTRGGTTYSWIRGKCLPSLLSGPLLERDRVVIVLSEPYNAMSVGNDTTPISRLTLGGITYMGNPMSGGKEQIVIDPWPSASIAPPFVVGSGQNTVGSPTNPFICKDQIGNSAGKYTCADIINGSLQCPENYSQHRVGFTDCDNRAESVATRGCCKQNAAVAAVPPASPTPTPTPINNILLAMALNIQDALAVSPTPTISITPTVSVEPTISIEPTVTTVPALADNLSVKLTVYNLTTNELIDGALTAPISFAKTPITKRQYSANVSPNNLQINKYFLVARTNNNMIAKTAFAVSNANQTITVPTTTLVFGDITKDKDITALDWNALRNCWGKSTKDNSSCTAADFDQSGNVDQIDFNILMRGWATWNEEGKIVNL